MLYLENVLINVFIFKYLGNALITVLFRHNDEMFCIKNQKQVSVKQLKRKPLASRDINTCCWNPESVIESKMQCGDLIRKKA